MHKSRRISFDLKTDKPDTVIEVSIRYSKSDYVGGENQGYWIGITPVKIDGVFRIQTAYSGVKGFLEGATRFGQKKLDNLASSIEHEVLTGHMEDRWPKQARMVAESNGVRITTWDPKNE